MVPTSHSFKLIPIHRTDHLTCLYCSPRLNILAHISQPNVSQSIELSNINLKENCIPLREEILWARSYDTTQTRMRSKHHNEELLRLTEELEQLNLRRDQVTERIDTLLLGEQHFSDRDGTTLEIGDKVSILTPGKYSFKEGTVVKLGNKRVTIKSTEGSTTSRKSTNLRKIWARCRPLKTHQNRVRVRTRRPEEIPRAETTPTEEAEEIKEDEAKEIHETVEAMGTAT